MILFGVALAAGPAEFVEVQTATLHDGLEVVVVQAPSASVVSLATVIHGGRADEPAPGLAWSAAASWFDGRASPVLSVEQAYDRLGATTDLSVGPDHTVFTTVVPPDGLPGVLALEWLRLSEPLAGVDVLSPVTHDASRVEGQAALFEHVFRELYPAEHPYAELWARPTADHPVYLAASWVSEQWRGDNTTLVVHGPVDANQLICGLEPEACPVVPVRVVEPSVELPKASLELVVEPATGGRVGPLAVGVNSVRLVAWALPGTDAMGGLLAELVRERVQAGLREHTQARCNLAPGRVATTLVCSVPVDADLDELGKATRKGWSTKKLAKDVQAWRERALGALLGSSAEADFPARLAAHVGAGGEPGPYAGGLRALAFDDGDVRTLLKAASWANGRVIELGP